MEEKKQSDEWQNAVIKNLDDNPIEVARRKAKSRDFLFRLLMVLVIAFMMFVCYYIYSHKEAFTSNPLTYWADRQGKDVDCMCTCTFYGDANRVARFTFNKTSIVPIIPTRINDVNLDYLNLSLITEDG